MKNLDSGRIETVGALVVLVAVVVLFLRCYQPSTDVLVAPPTDLPVSASPAPSN